MDQLTLPQKYKCLFEHQRHAVAVIVLRDAMKKKVDIKFGSKNEEESNLLLVERNFELLKSAILQLRLRSGQARRRSRHFLFLGQLRFIYSDFVGYRQTFQVQVNAQFGQRIEIFYFVVEF